jgi:hypothetical protein
MYIFAHGFFIEFVAISEESVQDRWAFSPFLIFKFF